MKSLYVLYPQLLVAVLVAYLVASGGSNGLAPLLDGEQTLTVAHVTGAPLVVDTANGSITVKKSNRADVQIVAKQAADPKSWIYVPVGTCSKINGASTTPKA